MQTQQLNDDQHRCYFDGAKIQEKVEFVPSKEACGYEQAAQRAEKKHPGDQSQCRVNGKSDYGFWSVGCEQNQRDECYSDDDVENDNCEIVG